MAELTNDKVRAIREEYAALEHKHGGIVNLARKYGVVTGTVARIVRGEGWKEVGGPVFPDPAAHGVALTREDVIAIRTALLSHTRLPWGIYTMLAERYGVNTSTITSIAQGETWKEVMPEFRPLNMKLAHADHIKNSVPRIFALVGEGMTFKQIGEYLDIPAETVGQIVSRRAFETVEIGDHQLSAEDKAHVARLDKEALEDPPERVLTPVNVREIRWLWENSKKGYGVQRAIAVRYGVTSTCISYIVKRQTWSTLPDRFDVLNKPAPLSPEEDAHEGSGPKTRASVSDRQVQEIRWLASQCDWRGAQTQIAKIYSLDKEYVSQLVRRLIRTDVPDLPEDAVKPELPPRLSRHESYGSAQKVLDEQKVLAIHWLWNEGGQKHGLQKVIAKHFDIDVQTVRSVLERKTWTYVELDYSKLDPKPELLQVETKRSNQKVSEQAIREMRYIWDHAPSRYGVALKLSRRYGVSTATVGNVVNRKLWTHIPDAFDTLDPKPTLEALPEQPSLASAK
jgi:DNA-binding CsgD family transcriptional regulator